MQAVLLYGLETCVLLEKMERKVEGIHTGFLCHITGKRERQRIERTWEDAWGRRRTGGSGNGVYEDLHGEMSGNHGSLGGAMSSI